MGEQNRFPRPHHSPVSCDDGNACTVDLCGAQTGCYSVANDGAACDDQKCLHSVRCLLRGRLPRDAA